MLDNDITDSKTGDRIMMFDTPCGFEITLLRSAKGEIKISSYFGHQPVNLTTSSYRLSLEGARLLADKLKQIVA